MNRFSRESAPPIRRRKPGAAAQLLLRRGEAKDESLDLFSAIRRSESPTISSSSSVAAATAAAAEEGELGRRSGVDDDLFYGDVGKSDYDWLLTPPGTPLFSSSKQSSASAKSASSIRSPSATKPSKLSVSSPPEIDTTTRSGRTVSAASSSASSNGTSSTPLSTAKSSLLSRSSASVTSRQTTMRPINTPASTTRLPSPARILHKPSPPSTPITRPRAPSTASSPRTVAPASRPNPHQSAPARSASVGRSAGAPARAAVQPDAMSKIKTKPTERPQSTGKQRSVTPASSNRGRIQENSTKKANPIETKRPSASNTAIRISAKPPSSSLPVESNGFGRNISKKSLDVAVRHTDIRQGAGGIRGASLFPHSIRSTAAKSRPIPATNKVALPTTATTTTTADNGSLDRAASECGSSTNGTISGERAKTEASVSGDSTTTPTKSQERKFTAARVSELDLYGISTRYDTMLLKEDARNLNWLRSVDDVSAESPTFHRFEPLPEPFGLV